MPNAAAPRAESSELRRFGATLLAAAVIPAACTFGSSDESGGPVPPSAPSPLEFVDVAQEVGLDFRHGAFRWDVSADPAAMLGGGVCWLDYDGDGWLDLFAVNSYAERESRRWERSGGLPRSALFRNVGGRFSNVSA